ncbi:hypothetical protein [Pleionea sediminis]|uniref:hypothetical protein n=1 Tax=Pleionea sediminis TaxID=2569479 RepID=UPI0011848E70|nr:hypothetical protein [Pleionea sediminis]
MNWFSMNLFVLALTIFSIELPVDTNHSSSDDEALSAGNAQSFYCDPTWVTEPHAPCAPGK